MKAHLFLLPLLLLTTATWAVAGFSEHPTVDYVLGMLEAGMEEEAIITRILEKNLTFRVAEGDIDRLRQAGASDRLIITIVREGVILENRRAAVEEDGAAESPEPGNGTWTRPRRLGKPEMVEIDPEAEAGPSEEAEPSGEAGDEEEESEEGEGYDEDYWLHVYLGGFAYLGYPFYSYPYYYGYPYGSIHYYPYGRYGHRQWRYGHRWHPRRGGYKWGHDLAHPRGSGARRPHWDGRHGNRGRIRDGANHGAWSHRGGWARGRSFKWSGRGRMGTGAPSSRGHRGRPRSR